MSFHSFHLALERCALSPSDTNALPERPLVGFLAAVTHCIVGYSQIAEFYITTMDNECKAKDDDGNDCKNSTRVSFTPYWQRMTIRFMPMTDLSIPPLQNLQHLRAVSIGPDCHVVLWGRWIVVNANDDNNDNVGSIVFH